MDASETPRDDTDGAVTTAAESVADRSARDDDGTDWYRRRWTTIALESDGDGWRATQSGVDVEGRGETAADAAASYCRRIAATGRRGGIDG